MFLKVTTSLILFNFQLAFASSSLQPNMFKHLLHTLYQHCSITYYDYSLHFDPESFIVEKAYEYASSTRFSDHWMLNNIPRQTVSRKFDEERDYFDSIDLDDDSNTNTTTVGPTDTIWNPRYKFSSCFLHIVGTMFMKKYLEEENVARLTVPALVLDLSYTWDIMSSLYSGGRVCTALTDYLQKYKYLQGFRGGSPIFLDVLDESDLGFVCIHCIPSENLETVVKNGRGHDQDFVSVLDLGFKMFERNFATIRINAELFLHDGNPPELISFVVFCRSVFQVVFIHFLRPGECRVVLEVCKDNPS